MNTYSNMNALNNYVRLIKNNKVTQKGLKNPQHIATARHCRKFMCISPSKHHVFVAVLEQDNTCRRQYLSNSLFDNTRPSQRDIW